METLYKITKSDWKLIIADELSKYNGKYDTLEIQAVYNTTSHLIKGRPKVQRVNYKTTIGNHTTSFGHFEFEIDELTNLLRKVNIDKIID